MRDRTAARVCMTQATRVLIDMESVSRIEEVTATDRESAHEREKSDREGKRERGSTNACPTS